MKFDVIIGNPPYQVNVDNTSAMPIYQNFIKQAKELEVKYIIMIVPSRWFSGGKGLDKFRGEMVGDRRMKEIHDFPNAKECFSNVDIKGGVNYFLWDRKHTGKCKTATYKDGVVKSVSERYLNEFGDFIIRDSGSLSILEKVKNISNEFMDSRVSSQTPFNLYTNFSNYLDTEFEGAIKLYGNKVLMKETNGVGYISLEQITKGFNLINLHKVYIPKAGGSGNDGPILGQPFYGEQNSVCTQTYLVVDFFNTKEEAINLINYIKTKFFRFLISTLKNTQHAPKKVYQFVPILDMTETWTDEKLYKKYSLTQDEINYIEQSIREMK